MDLILIAGVLSTMFLFYLLYQDFINPKKEDKRNRKKGILNLVIMIFLILGPPIQYMVNGNPVQKILTIVIVVIAIIGLMQLLMNNKNIFS